ncbi:hypothetical protein K443DRAFT_94669 [Laccaria amethystina LaAM-08-1]|uniref:Uncharacterized protein n=1 Tax=Laccaria amethystina LaAM-08-1 TaxID=1095629 RepID=A0A0C9WVY2_9AGAR|nr:hypothetical protein K443DRAFT_94669 [Laccaria amethystina LaAM-08-1]
MVKFIVPAAILIAAPLIAFATEQQFTRELGEVDVYTRDNFEDTVDFAARDLESSEYEIAERGLPFGAISGIAHFPSRRSSKGLSSAVKIGTKVNNANNRYQNVQSSYQNLKNTFQSIRNKVSGGRGRRDLEGLYERDFDEELELVERDLPQDALEFVERDFDEDLLEREFDEELLEREVDEDILERDVEEDILVRELYENLMEREVDEDILEREFDEDLMVRDDEDAILERDFDEELMERGFDDLEEREVDINELD